MRLSGIYRVIFVSFTFIGIMGVVYYLFHFTFFFGLYFIDIGYFYFLLAFFVTPVFLIYPIHKGKDTNHIPWYDVTLAVLFFALTIYFYINAKYMVPQAWEIMPPKIAKYCSVIMVILALEAGRRVGGNALGIICLFFALMPIFAHHLPSFMRGGNFSFWETMAWHTMGRESIIGMPLKVVATILIGFLIFGVALVITGGGEFFLNLANSIFGRTRGGAAKVSIISSGLFGSISGSIISNIVTTGSFTIPAMKKTGYPAEYAAAIETCASTGGVMMPPIMGATAFIMAEFLSIPYATVVIAALVPSFLYYMGLFVQIDCYAGKARLRGMPKKDIPSLKETLKEGWYYIGAFLVLLWFLFYERTEPQAPFYAIVTLFFLAMFRKKTRLTPRKMLDWLEGSGKVIVQITALLCAIGFIIGSLIGTGVASSFTYEIIKLAGGHLGIILFFSAISSFVLGMGVTISGCYVILALIVAPSLIEFGLDPIAVHLFILYCGLFSFVTPPVAIGAYAAAGLANSNPMRTAFRAMQFGFVKYIIPFFFVLSPSLILRGPLQDVVVDIATVIFAVFLMGSALEGYLLGIGAINIQRRIFAFISGLLLGLPGLYSDLSGIILALLLLVYHLVTRKKSANH